MAETLFHMWGRYRSRLIDNHNFYIEQARKRLLSQFSNIEEEAKNHADEWLEKVSHHFDPERHDPSDFYDQAREESYEFYQLLDNMRAQTSLSVVAGLYHEWDKQMRGWLIKELSHWHRGETLKNAIWKANFNEIMELFEGLGWKIKIQQFYTSLDRCRLVVNAYKHGDGDAFKTIKAKYPEFIDGGMKDSDFVLYADHSDLKVSEEHINEFSDAVVKFWEGVPEYIVNTDAITVPAWFSKAYQKDVDLLAKK